MRKVFIMLTGVTFISLFLAGCTSAKAGTEPVMSNVLCDAGNELLSDSSADEAISGQSEDIVSKVLVVYVCGAVTSPGVYELSVGSRVNDAVNAAGGFGDEADTDYINLAAEISDGAKLRIPTREETEKMMEKSDVLADGVFTCDNTELNVDTNSKDSGLININTASEDELKTLPGIGDSISARIVKYRQENGSFKSVEDIKKISGIKDKLFSKIKEYITV
ncbi:MAG: helix-hairpin-helix domain-containing protein [Butyrivibrio sp.]|nr:helix-hairpin-helix domain-containing protein [Butyrivibrio sp.]